MDSSTCMIILLICREIVRELHNLLILTVSS